MSGNRAQASLRAFFAKTSAFAFGCSTPDTELFLVVQRVVETRFFDLAIDTNFARSLRRTTAFGKEDLGIDAYIGASRVGLPIDRLKKLVRDALHPPALSTPRHAVRADGTSPNYIFVILRVGF